MVEPHFHFFLIMESTLCALRHTHADGSLNISFQAVVVFSFGLVNLCFWVSMSFNTNVIESWSLESWIGPELPVVAH